MRIIYVIEHALTNLGKNKGRNILLGAVIFAVVAAAVAALAIYDAAEKVVEETKTALMCAARIAPKRQSPGGAVTAGGARPEETLSLSQYLSFAESGYLDGADIKESARPGGIDAVYYLKRPDMLAEFETELRTKGLPDDYTLTTDESAFERVTGPVESLKSLSLTFLLIVLVLGAVIMALLSIIAVRERKYEIGVLRAMGMKKRHVAFGLWIEILALTCVCFIFGLGAGAGLSQPVSDMIMAGQTRQSESKSTTLAERLFATGPARPEQVDAPVNVTAALQIFVIIVLLASVAGFASAGRIVKNEPIKILMERH